MTEAIVAAVVNAAVSVTLGWLIKALIVAAPLAVAGLIAAALHWHPSRRRAA